VAPELPLTVSPDAMVAELEDEAVILHMGTRRYYRLNETAALIWKELSRGADLAGVVARLTSEYQVDPGIAGERVRTMVESLLDSGLVEP